MLVTFINSITTQTSLTNVYIAASSGLMLSEVGTLYIVAQHILLATCFVHPLQAVAVQTVAAYSKHIRMWYLGCFAVDPLSLSVWNTATSLTTCSV